MQRENHQTQIGWATPLYVKSGHGAPVEIKGPQEALFFLEVRWPTERGAKYELACIVCANAVERRESSEVAREAFTAAAIEAHILV